MGFKHGSGASLIMASLSSIVLCLSAYLSYHKKYSGYILALVQIFFLDMFFSYRFLNSLKFIPSGMMSLLSLGAFLIIAYKAKKQAD